MDIQVTSDGTVSGTQVVTESGEDITGSVTGIRWDANASANHVSLAVDLLCIPMTFNGRVTDWYGLEDVPTEALHAELGRRAAQES